MEAELERREAVRAKRCRCRAEGRRLADEPERLLIGTLAFLGRFQ